MMSRNTVGHSINMAYVRIVYVHQLPDCNLIGAGHAESHHWGAGTHAGLCFVVLIAPPP